MVCIDEISNYSLSKSSSIEHPAFTVVKVDSHLVQTHTHLRLCTHVFELKSPLVESAVSVPADMVT